MMTDAIVVDGHRFTTLSTEENEQRHGRRATRINIGKQMERWLTLKAIIGLWRNEEVAKMLMDSWSSVNGIYLEDGTELPEIDASSDSKEEEGFIEDECEDLPILERQLEDWEVLSREKVIVNVPGITDWKVLSKEKTTSPDITDSNSSPPSPAATIQPQLKSFAILKQTAQQAQSHQHIQIKILPQVKNLQQVQNGNQIQKSNLVKIAPKPQVPSLQTQNAAPVVNKHLMFFPKTGGKPLLVIPNTGMGPKSLVTGGCEVPFTVTGSVQPLTEGNSQTTMTSPKVSASRTSPGKNLPVMITKSVLQPSNCEQVVHSDCDIKQINFEIKNEPVSDEELDNKVNKTDEVHLQVVDHDQTISNTSREEVEDLILNMYCSSGDDADDDDDEDEDEDEDDDNDEKYRTDILKPSLLALDANKTMKKHETSQPGDVSSKDINLSPKKVNLESNDSNDTAKCFRSERLRKRGRISFVELLKGNVVFEKGRNGKIYAKERETTVKTTSPEKVKHSKEKKTSVNNSLEESSYTGNKMHKQKKRSNSCDSEVIIDDCSSSEEVRYSESDSDFDPDGMSSNVNLKTRKRKRKTDSVSSHSGGEHNLITTKKKAKMSDRVVCFGGS